MSSLWHKHLNSLTEGVCVIRPNVQTWFVRYFPNILTEAFPKIHYTADTVHLLASAKYISLSNCNSLDLYSGGGREWVPGLNFYRHTGLPKWGLHCPYYLHASVWIVPRLDHDGILVSPFKFIVHQLPGTLNSSANMHTCSHIPEERNSNILRVLRRAVWRFCPTRCL